MMQGSYQEADGFSINEIKCPSCGGPLDLPDGTELATCKFCGSTVHVSYRHRESGVGRDGTIRDPGSGYGLFRVKPLPDWQVTSASLQRTGSSSRPCIPEVQMGDGKGGSITLRMGDAGVRNSAGMNALMSMYTGHLAGVSTVNYADVPDPLALANSIGSSIAVGAGASRFRLDRQLACPDLEARRNKEFARFQRFAQAEGGSVANPLTGVVLRVYELEVSGKSWKLAVFVELGAAKDGSGLGEGIGGLMGGIGGLMGSIGTMFGGNVVAPFGGQQPQAPQQAMPQSAGWCEPDFAAYTSSGTIFWSVTFIATFMAPADQFDGQFESAFLPFVGSLEVHPDVDNLSIQVVHQEAARIQQATQGQLSQNQAAFNAQQAAHRQQQAAFDSYNQSISASRDARHQRFMASSREQFDHRASDFSEAIRGVNTYRISDGREVEVSLHADRAFENQAGDVIGTSGGFEPGANWTEIPRV